MTFHGDGPTWTVDGAFSVGVRTDGAAVRVSLRGDLDVATAEHLDAVLDQLRRDGHRTLVLDLTELSFCDASGLTVLFAAHRRLAADGGVLRLTGARPTVTKLLTITGLDTVLDMQPSPLTDVEGYGTLRSARQAG